MAKKDNPDPNNIVKIAIMIVIILVAIMAVILIHNHKSANKSTETPGVPVNQSNPSGNTTTPDPVDKSNGTNDQVPSQTGTGPGSTKSLLGPGPQQ